MKLSHTQIVLRTRLSILALLSCLLIAVLLFSACDNGRTDPPDTTVPPDDTSEGVMTDDVTTSIPDDTTLGGEETTVPPPPPAEYSVIVYTPGGDSSVHTVIEGGTLSADIFRALEVIAPSDGVEASFVGWECSVGEGERIGFDPDAATPISSDMSIYPIVSYRYRVKLLSGEGAFGSGDSLEFYVDADSEITLLGLTSVMPEKAGDIEYTYTLAGYRLDGKDYGIREKIKVSSPLTFTAFYQSEEIVYTVTVQTPYGELIGGGKEKTFKGGYRDALAFLEAYNSFVHEDVTEGDTAHIYSHAQIVKNGTEWSVVLIWTEHELRYTLTFDFTFGEPLLSRVSADGHVILPTPDGVKEDEIGYYTFIGWRGDDGILYSAASDFVANDDHTFVAEYELAEKRVYYIEFITDFGKFANGSDKVVLSGNYGDPLISPIPPDASGPVFGNVVYTFDGWDGDIPETITEDAVFYARYTTPAPANRISYYLNGELYCTQHYYVGEAIILPELPAGAETKIFSGWGDVPETMPSEEIVLFGTLRPARVIYMLDGVVVSDTEVAIGSFVTLASPAVKEGYTVSGWTTEDIGGVLDQGFEMPAHDVVFRATSTPAPHKVIYILDGVEIYVDEVAYGDIYTVRGIEVKEGYSFSGWIAPDTAISTDSGIIVIPDSDVVFVASFSICSYDVHYYLEGALLYTDRYEFGRTVTLRPNEEQSGCTFEWHAVGMDVSSGSFLMPAGDVEIYGTFSDGDNKITYIINGEIFAVVGHPAGQTVKLLETPIYHGFTFSGWSCADYDIGDGEFLMPEGELVLRGSFIPNTYDIYFWDMRTHTVLGMGQAEYRSSFAIGDAEYCTAGYVSGGWVLVSGNAYPAGGNSYIMPDSEVHFAAKWRECLTLSYGDGYWFPWYEESDGSFLYDSETNTLYIYDAQIVTAGESGDIKVVYVAADSE